MFDRNADLEAPADPLAVQELRRALEELMTLQQECSDQLAKVMAVIADLAGTQTEALALLREIEQDLELASPASERAALRAEAQQARRQARSLRAERAGESYSPPGLQAD